MSSGICSRRGFLKGCAAAATSFAAPHCLRAGASPKEKLNLALVGAGGRGASRIASIGREAWLAVRLQRQSAPLRSGLRRAALRGCLPRRRDLRRCPANPRNEHPGLDPPAP